MIHFSSIETIIVEKLIRLESRATPQPWSSHDLQSSLASGADGCVIECDGERAGYYVVQRVLDEAELLNIVIFKDHQSKGYGYDTIIKVKSGLVVTGVKTLYLEVRASNVNAQNLYRKTGFEMINIRKNYYKPERTEGKAEDAVVMSCCLA